MSFNAKEFGEVHGKKYTRKIKAYGELGYLGEHYKDEATGAYCIHESTPVPFDADKRVTRIPTLWMQLLSAATECRSVFPSMYPKLPDRCFERQLDELIKAEFIRIVPTESGVPYLELQHLGFEFMEKLTQKEQRATLDKVEKVISVGLTIAQAFAAVLPSIVQSCPPAA